MHFSSQNQYIVSDYRQLRKHALTTSVNARQQLLNIYCKNDLVAEEPNGRFEDFQRPTSALVFERGLRWIDSTAVRG
jgi:hypothetical protein